MSEREVRTRLDGPTYERLKRAAAVNRTTLSRVLAVMVNQGIRASEEHQKQEAS
jgi:hypothetical protein